MGWFRKPSSTPLWQDEFSVFTADERYVNRRQFTKFLTLTSFGMLVGNLWILARSAFHRAPVYPRVAVALADEIAVGGVKTFAYPTADDPCILVRTSADTLCRLQSKMYASLVRRVLSRRSRTVWNARATRAFSRLRMARCCRVRRSARCRASRWKGETAN